MSDGGYGYARRRDVPDRLVPVPPQAVPLSQLPNDARDVIKDSDALVEHFQAYAIIQEDTTLLLGESDIRQGGSGGGAGSTTDTQRAWYSRIGRFCYMVDASSTGTPFRWTERRIRVDFSPFTLLDTDLPRTPWVVAFEDVLAMEHSYTSNGSAAFYFGVSVRVTTSAISPLDGDFVGFYAVKVDGASPGYGNWFARIGDSAGPVTADLGVTTELPHRLRCEMDGAAKQARFYVDGVLTATLDTANWTSPFPNVEAYVGWFVAAGGTGVHTSDVKVGYWMDNQAIASVRILSEVA